MRQLAQPTGLAKNSVHRLQANVRLRVWHCKTGPCSHAGKRAWKCVDFTTELGNHVSSDEFIEEIGITVEPESTVNFMIVMYLVLPLAF